MVALFAIGMQEKRPVKGAVMAKLAGFLAARRSGSASDSESEDDDDAEDEEEEESVRCPACVKMGDLTSACRKCGKRDGDDDAPWKPSSERGRPRAARKPKAPKAPKAPKRAAAKEKKEKKKEKKEKKEKKKEKKEKKKRPTKKAVVDEDDAETETDDEKKQDAKEAAEAKERDESKEEKKRAPPKKTTKRKGRVEEEGGSKRRRGAKTVARPVAHGDGGGGGGDGDADADGGTSQPVAVAVAVASGGEGADDDVIVIDPVVRALQQQVGELEAKCATKQRQFKELQAEAERTIEEVEAHVATVASLRRDLEKRDGELKEAIKELGDANERHADGEAAWIEERRVLRESLERAERARGEADDDALKDHLQIALEGKNESDAALAEVQSQHSALSKKFTKLEVECAGLRRAIERHNSKRKR